MEREAPGSYLSTQGPIPLRSPEAGTAPALPAGAPTFGHEAGRQGGRTPPGTTCLSGGGAGGFDCTQLSRGGVARPGRAARPHDVNPQASALFSRLPRVTRATEVGWVSVAFAPPPMQMIDVTRAQW